MRPTPFAIVTAVILVFIAVGGYLIFGRGGTGTGKPVTVNVSVTGAKMNPPTINVHQGDQVTMNVTGDPPARLRHQVRGREGRGYRHPQVHGRQDPKL